MNDGAAVTSLFPYVGRFAPSPSGQLHFGSLVTALASYLDARHHHGTWYVRMEDIDEPRCISGMDTHILNTLERHGFCWDGEVIYQSQSHERYKAQVDTLLSQNKAYLCTCTRKQIMQMGGRYDGRCRDASPRNINVPHAVRLKVNASLAGFTDGIMGGIESPNTLCEDVIIKRRDGLYSYNLVVILDDDFQGINHIVRGADLLPVTPTHVTLYQRLGLTQPDYCHIPVAAVAPGRKLSKQNHATPLDNNNAIANLHRAMTFLGLSPMAISDYGNVEQLLSHAVSEWRREKVPKNREVIVDKHESTYYSEPL